MVHGDLQGTISSITRVLSSELIDLEEERAAEANGKAFKSTDARKNNIKAPLEPCPVCGSMKHWAKKCWQNVNADDETKRRAPKNTPAGQAWAKKQSAAATGGTGKPEVAKKDQTSSDDATALLAQQDDLLAAALDNRESSDIDIGRAAIAIDENMSQDYINYLNSTGSLAACLSQDYQDYLSEESDDEEVDDSFSDEEEQHTIAQRLGTPLSDPVQGVPVSPPQSPPVPAIRPMAPILQNEPALLSQLENARQRLSARSTSPLASGSRDGRHLHDDTQGTITSTIRTSMPFRRTVHLTESTDEGHRDVLSAPQFHFYPLPLYMISPR